MNFIWDILTQDMKEVKYEDSFTANRSNVHHFSRWRVGELQSVQWMKGISKPEDEIYPSKLMISQWRLCFAVESRIWCLCQDYQTLGNRISFGCWLLSTGSLELEPFDVDVHVSGFRGQTHLLLGPRYYRPGPHYPFPNH